MTETLTNPPLAVGLNGLHDWSTAQPFLDHFKMARPWTGMVGGRFGVIPFPELQAAGAIDPQGWLLSVPPGVEAVSTVLLTELDANALDLAERYVMTWQGQAEVTVHGASNLERDGNRIRFDFAPDAQHYLEIRVSAVTQPLHDIRVIQQDNLARHAAGRVFRCEWLDLIRDYRLLRFMDWMLTNDSVQQDWDNRPRIDDAFYTWRGAPVEVMVRLCNEIGADGWFNIPHLATPVWIARFAGHIRDNLNPNLRAYYEYSNEMWNMGFGQTQWAIEQARPVWPGQGDGFMQFYAARAVAMADILDRVHAAGAVGHVKVISSQTHWLGLEGAALDAPNWQADNPLRPPPYRHFDAYAVSGYFDGGLDRDDNVQAVSQLLASGSEMQARTALRDQILHGGWSESGRTVASLRETWDYHATVARDRGLDLIMYEGGTHITPPAAVQADAALAAFYARFNYSAEMGQIYTAALDAWRAAGGDLFNIFVECARPASFGYWGLQRHVGDENPRWAAVESWNRSHAGDTDRAEDSFVGSLGRKGCAGPP